MEITMKGDVLKLNGNPPKVGDKAPDFTLVNTKKQIFHLEDLTDKPLIISVVPNIDTSVCALQTKRFNKEAAAEESIHFVTISNNTVEEQQKWCAAEGVEMTMLHDTELTFGNAYGIYIPQIEHLARSIFVVDTNGVIIYEEIVAELTNEPDYGKALAAAKGAAK